MTTDSWSKETIHEEPHWTTDPGKLTHAVCPVCGEDCRIERNVTGPTCFAQAVAGRTSLHDCVVCPHAAVAWHNRAARLQRAIAQTPSRRLAAMMQAELDELVREMRRQPRA